MQNIVIVSVAFFFGYFKCVNDTSETQHLNLQLTIDGGLVVGLRKLLFLLQRIEIVLIKLICSFAQTDYAVRGTEQCRVVTESIVIDTLIKKSHCFPPLPFNFSRKSFLAAVWILDILCDTEQKALIKSVCHKQFITESCL